MIGIIQRTLCLLLALAGASVALAADPYPTRTIRIIANSGAGALTDAHARALATKMSETLGQPVIVENIAGAGGLLGIKRLKEAAADGYTLMVSSNTIALNLALRQDPGFELKEFAPVGAIAQYPLYMVGSPSFPHRNLAELVAHAKANPGTMSFASGGPATPTFLAAALLAKQAAMNLVHVPYKGVAPAFPDVLAGRVNFVFDSGTVSGPHTRAGHLRTYGVTSTKRSAANPHIPTIAEQGFPNYSYVLYTCLVAPAGTPREVVQRLAQALRFAVNSEAMRERFRAEGSEPLPLSPEEFGDYLRQDAQRNIKLVEETGMEKE